LPFSDRLSANIPAGYFRPSREALEV